MLHLIVKLLSVWAIMFILTGGICCDWGSKLGFHSCVIKRSIIELSRYTLTVCSVKMCPD